MCVCVCVCVCVQVDCGACPGAWSQVAVQRVAGYSDGGKFHCTLVIMIC